MHSIIRKFPTSGRYITRSTDRGFTCSNVSECLVEQVSRPKNQRFTAQCGKVVVLGCSTESQGADKKGPQSSQISHSIYNCSLLQRISRLSSATNKSNHLSTVPDQQSWLSNSELLFSPSHLSTCFPLPFSCSGAIHRHQPTTSSTQSSPRALTTGSKHRRNAINAPKPKSFPLSYPC